MSLLGIERIDVDERAVEALVRVDPARMRTSDWPGLAERLIASLPGLRRHRCENDAHRRFVDEVRDTELPHLLEHTAFELMALSGSPRTLKGETVWDFARDGRGVFRVRLEFDSDLVVLGALKEAVSLIEAAAAPSVTVSPDDAVARLVAARAAAE